MFTGRIGNRLIAVGLALGLGAIACAAPGLGGQQQGVGDTPTAFNPTEIPAAADTGGGAGQDGSQSAPKVQAASESSNAQPGGGSASTPVMLLTSTNKGIEGDLQVWDGSSLNQITDWKHNFLPVISPDGKWAVYQSVAQAVIDAGPGGAGSGFPPVSLWLVELGSGEATRIAGQPDGAPYPSDQLVYRNARPSWSPDSSALAWVERDGGGERLAIYTLATKNTQSIPLNLPAQCCEGAFRSTFWGPGGAQGVAIDSDNGDSPDKVDQVVYTHAATDTGSTVTIPLTAQVFGWVSQNGQAVLAAMDGGQVILIDPATGQSTPAAGTLALASGGPLSVVGSADQSSWTLRDNGKDVATLAFSPFEGGVALSPDGTQAVFMSGDDPLNPTVTIYGSGQMTPVKVPAGLRVNGVTWGALAWELAQ